MYIMLKACGWWNPQEFPTHQWLEVVEYDNFGYHVIINSKTYSFVLDDERILQVWDIDPLPSHTCAFCGFTGSLTEVQSHIGFEQGLVDRCSVCQYYAEDLEQSHTEQERVGNQLIQTTVYNILHHCDYHYGNIVKTTCCHKLHEIIKNKQSKFLARPYGSIFDTRVDKHGIIEYTCKYGNVALNIFTNRWVRENSRSNCTGKLLRFSTPWIIGFEYADGFCGAQSFALNRTWVKPCTKFVQGVLQHLEDIKDSRIYVGPHGEDLCEVYGKNRPELPEA